MAPSDTAYPRKRKQPAFKPPRPKTTTDGGVTKSKSKAKASASTRISNIGSIFNEGTKKSKAKTKPRAKAVKQRAAVEEVELEDNDDDEETEENEAETAENLLDIDAEAEAEDVPRDNNEDSDDEPDHASSADMMLAEITSAPSSSSLSPTIPIPLLHRLMHHSFKNPEETKLSTDARACVGRYIETFIREGIARCAFEVGEKVHEGGSDSALGHDDGWLEVEDLERVGGQLVVDF